MKIYLASASPRRRTLLQKLGLEFELIEPEYEELLEKGIDPKAYARQNAIGKARSVLSDINDGLIITADTIVVINGEILEKPRDREDAVRMLKKLSGSSHFVYTAVVVLDAETRQMEVELEETEVVMRDLADREIQQYVESGEPMDAAGAYKIQEGAAKFIKRICGCYHNVIGLPIATLAEMLKKFSVEME
jgi:septum formation protein